MKNRKIEEQTKKTAKHIGIISEGAIQTLIEETRQELKAEWVRELEKYKDEHGAIHISRTDYQNLIKKYEEKD